MYMYIMYVLMYMYMYCCPLQVCNESMVGLTHEEAVGVLKATPMTVLLKIEKGALHREEASPERNEVDVRHTRTCTRYMYTCTCKAYPYTLEYSTCIHMYMFLNVHHGCIRIELKGVANVVFCKQRGTQDFGVPIMQYRKISRLTSPCPPPLNAALYMYMYMYIVLVLCANIHTCMYIYNVHVHVHCT